MLLPRKCLGPSSWEIDMTVYCEDKCYKVIYAQIQINFSTIKYIYDIYLLLIYVQK
jgi:hypothetical protein